MKTTVVPAQITTVEDKIAGSLNFIQIILLVFSLIVGTALYELISPRLHLTTFKIVLVVIQFSIFGSLALRYKGRIVAEWLIILLRFKARPRIYVFDKNDSSGRPELKISSDDIKGKSKERVADSDSKSSERCNEISPEYCGKVIAVRPSKKGGLDVEYQEA